MVISIYTPEVVADISKRYQAAPTPETVAILAKELEVGTRSIIAKLSALGIYVKKSYVNKQGNVPVPKEHYITEIGKLLDIDATILDSLEKVTKQALVLIEARIRLLQDE